MIFVRLKDSYAKINKYCPNMKLVRLDEFAIDDDI